MTSDKPPKLAVLKQQCAYWWERRSKGNRYVNARGQCKRFAMVGKSYCSEHKYMERTK